MERDPRAYLWDAKQGADAILIIRSQKAAVTPYARRRRR